METSASILILAKGYFPDDGGIERYSREMAQAYAAIGRNVYVLTQCSGPLGVWQDGNVTVENVGYSKKQYLIFVRLLCRLIRLKGARVFSLVHATTWRMALPFYTLRMTAPLLITVHGREVLVVSVWLRPLMQYVLKVADIVCAVSPTTLRLAEKLVKSPRGRWFTEWNGLSFPEPTKLRQRETDQKIRIYSFCRLIERKNIDNALRAVALLVERGHRNFEYYIAGSGPLEAELKALSNDLQLHDYVRFLGRIADEDIAPLYQQADIFLHPQISCEGGKDIEGFGLTIADAMSFGVPVVVGEDGGPADFVMNRVTGYVLDGHNVVEIADTLEALMLDDILRNRLGKDGSEWVIKNFSWKITSLKILEHLNHP